MSLTYGFYNSQSGDRVYSTTQISDFLDGLIEDGVYKNINDGDHVGLMVAETTPASTNVQISKGRAWFNGTWTYIDSAYEVTLTTPSALLSRIDAICLTINKNRASRSNYIEVIEGTGAANNPVKPTVQNETGIYRHVLGWVRVPAGATSLSQANIENNIGTSTVPFIKGVVEEGISVNALESQWKTEFDEWFDYMKGQLTTDAAGSLQTQIDNVAKVYTGALTYNRSGSSEFPRQHPAIIELDNSQAIDDAHLSYLDESVFIIRFEALTQQDAIIPTNGLFYDVYINDLIGPITLNLHTDSVFTPPFNFIFRYDYSNEVLDLIGIGTIDDTSGGTAYSPALITSGAVNSKVTEMQTTFRDGVDAVYNAVVAEGVTPSASTPTAIAEAIAQIRTPNQGAWTGSGTPSGNNYVDVAIPAGYHNGSGYVRANGGTAYTAGGNVKKTVHMGICIYNVYQSGGGYKGTYAIYNNYSLGLLASGTFSWSEGGGAYWDYPTVYASSNNGITTS